MGADATLFLTRPLDRSRRFLAACEAAAERPLPAVLSPVMGIVPVAARVGARPAAVILTSEAGAARAGELGLAGLPAWCVGAQTAEAAARAGLDPRPPLADAEALVAAMLAARPAGPLLRLRGEHERGAVAERLGQAGLDAREVAAYAQVAVPPTPKGRAALAGAAPLVVPLFSPRSAGLLADHVPLRAPLHVVAQSGAVARAARRLPVATLDVAAHPDGPAMVAATLARLDALGREGGRGGGPAAGGRNGVPP